MRFRRATRNLTALGWSAFATEPGTQAPATPAFSAFAAPQPAAVAAPASAPASAPAGPASAIPTFSNATPASQIVQTPMMLAAQMPSGQQSWQNQQGAPQIADPGDIAYQGAPDSSGNGGGSGDGSSWFSSLSETDWLLIAAACIAFVMYENSK